MIIKRLLLLGGIALTLAACKKTYICECTMTLGSTISHHDSEMEFSTKQAAVEACANNENLTGTPKVECTLRDN